MWNNNSLTNHYWICAWKNSNLPEFHNFIKFHHQTARQISFKMHQCLLHLPDTFIGYYTSTTFFMNILSFNVQKIVSLLSVSPQLLDAFPQIGNMKVLRIVLKKYFWFFMSSVKYLFHKKLLKMLPKKCTLQNCLEKLWISVDGLSALQHRHRAS